MKSYAAVKKNKKVFCPDLERVPDRVNEENKVANIILYVPFCGGKKKRVKTMHLVLLKFAFTGLSVGSGHSPIV